MHFHKDAQSLYVNVHVLITTRLFWDHERTKQEERTNEKESNRLLCSFYLKIL